MRWSAAPDQEAIRAQHPAPVLIGLNSELRISNLMMGQNGYMHQNESMKTMNLKSLLIRAMGDIITAHSLSLIELSDSEILMKATNFTVDVRADREGVRMVYFDTRSKPAKGYNLLLFLLNKRRDRLTFNADVAEPVQYEEYIEVQIKALARHIRSAGADILSGDVDWISSYSWPTVHAQGSATTFL